MKRKQKKLKSQIAVTIFAGSRHDAAEMTQWYSTLDSRRKAMPYSLEVKNIFMYYLFPNIYTYFQWIIFSKIIMC